MLIPPSSFLVAGSLSKRSAVDFAACLFASWGWVRHSSARTWPGTADSFFGVLAVRLKMGVL
ncbi:hypothetical protein SAMN04488061_1368 [Filomicrobium insigne]|uniref:Uncharacterized protein n=1 Tax=Filomicrobium insigne TaxID=418854 RepID=A0A1H0LHW4_9HYPH|nr:hypothetical protein SAMN04488061_1368 [Filomicrobium insigne]